MWKKVKITIPSGNKGKTKVKHVKTTITMWIVKKKTGNL